jgi:hypothetical protein
MLAREKLRSGLFCLITINTTPTTLECRVPPGCGQLVSDALSGVGWRDGVPCAVCEQRAGK